MADIKHYWLFSHLRAQPTSHVIRYRKGQPAESGPGATFWFRRLTSAVAEIPVDDREQTFVFTGRTADFQDVTVQGTITYRVAAPDVAARRIDFGIDLSSGSYLEQPLERIATMVSQAAQQIALDWIAHRRLDEVLREAIQGLRPLVASGLAEDPTLAAVGLEVVTVRLSRIAPTPELEQALQAPTREQVQQASDEAVFRRRALAVEKERAIAENELANQIELARREQELIAERTSNEQATAESGAAVSRIHSAAEADGLRLVEASRNESEAARLAMHRDLPTAVVLSMAARELAGKLERIDHLNISPDGLKALLESLATAATRRLEG